MKFRQKIVLFLVIVVVDLILCGVTLRMWKEKMGKRILRETCIMKEIKRKMSQRSRKIEKTGTSCRGNRTWYGRRRPI